MLNFKELPEDGQAFEQLIRETLFAMGMHVLWSGRGADGGRDLLCKEKLTGHLAERTFTWLVQCKHFAHSGRSVGVADLDNIADSCAHHRANGFLLACSTQPSSAVVSRLEAIAANDGGVTETKVWDGVQIERLLSHPRRWSVAQRFFPKTANGWQIYATEEPNDFVAHYKGYVFHITNRIYSDAKMHLESIERRILEIESIDLPRGHFIRPRCVWYNGKSPEYVWYIDYMRPNGEKKAISTAEIQYILKDGWALEDGQLYSWNVSCLEYFPHSDHYDKDHYDYYSRFIPNFLTGRSRPNDRDWGEYFSDQQRIQELDRKAKDVKDTSFRLLVDAFEEVPFLKVMRSRNAQIEELHLFERRYNWEDILTDIGFTTGSFFSARFVLCVSDKTAFLDMFEKMPIDIGRTFRLAQAVVYLPKTGRSKEDNIFDLTLSCVPVSVANQWDYRIAINQYFKDFAQALREFSG